NGIFTSPDQAGTFDVTYMFTDNNGCSASATDIVKVFDCTGIEGIQSDYVGIYPNPSRSFVQLEASFRIDVSTIRLMDATGRIVNAPIEKTGEKTCIIHLENLAAGLYQVSVNKGTELYTVKLVKSL
ncbi:MAG: T9SS type A sorting domain-containing protein, partial [Bacteroidetes bacterium]|nr:T9SS type A sorting domain-containing protein [Bacteroidota bacterium]